MIMLFSLFLALILVAAAHATTCPSGCTCSSTTITCNGLAAFPKIDFPEVTTFRLTSSNCSIPENAFARLPSLRTIDISKSNISKIGSCAFAGLTLSYLIISNSNIGVIKPGAFSNVEVTSHVTISRSEIKKFSSNSFYKISGNYININYCQISKMMPYSFNEMKVYLRLYNCNITTLDKFALNVTNPSSRVYSTTIKNLGCRSFNGFTNLPYSLTVRCDCDLIPAIKAKSFRNPIKCLKDSELHGAIPGFGADCSLPVVPTPPQCPSRRH